MREDRKSTAALLLMLVGVAAVVMLMKSPQLGVLLDCIAQSCRSPFQRA